MRETNILWQVLGIRLRVHYTWLLGAGLITAAIVTQFSTAYPLWQRLVLGATGSLIFFFVIIIREFILALISSKKGVKIDSNTLFIFGGLHQIDSNSSLPSVELLVSFLGQMLNLIIAGIFALIYFLLVQTDNIIVDVLIQWLAFIFLMLAFFHFVPGYPLDGGRALRALLWRSTGSYEKATSISGWVGWIIGIFMSAGGIAMLVLTNDRFTGAFLVFLGLVLQNAATNGRRLVGRALSNTTEQQIG